MDEEQQPSGEANAVPNHAGNVTGMPKQQGTSCEDQLATCKEEFARALADRVNAEKQHERYLSEFIKYAAEDVVKRVLPLKAMFDFALEGATKANEKDGWAKGIFQIAQEFSKILSQLGVKEIEAKGKYFDPKYHEAVEMAEGEEYLILEVLERGYQWEDGRVIRPARAKVGKGIKEDGKEKENKGRGEEVMLE